MNTSDVQVHDYVTDDGRRISISLATFGDVDADRKVTASVVVDGVERLHSTHWRCPAGVELGEWLIFSVMQCLCSHMVEYYMYEIMNNLLTKANGDEVETVPIDDRHIPELTDEQMEWWNDDGNHPLVDYILAKVKPAAEKAAKENPQLRANKENS